MKNSMKMKEALSVMLSVSMAVTAGGVLPMPLQAFAAETTVTPVRSWDFSQDAAGWYYGDKDWVYQYSGNENSSVSYDGEKEALKATVDYSQDGDSSWSQAGICYYTDDGMDLTGVNNVTFDIFYDTVLRTKGGFSVKAFTNAGVDQYVSVNPDTEEVVEGTLVKNQVSIDFAALLEEKGSFVNDFTLALIGVNTDYQGDIWIDNVSLNKVETNSIEEVELGSFDFEDGIDGWYYGDGWEYQYNGTLPTIEAENGRLKVNVDYSQDKDKDWSNIAVCYWNDEGLHLKGASRISMDVWFETDKLTEGELKIAAYSNAGIDSNTSLTELEEEEGTGLTKGRAVLTIPVLTEETMQDLGVKIVGCNTDYKGAVYLDNIKFSALVDTADTSVDSTIQANKGNPAVSDGDTLTVAGKDGSLQTAEYAKEVTIVDPDATKETVALYQYLQAMGKTDSVIYGHQNDTWHKAGAADLSDSDTFDVTGMYAGVMGIDTLSMTGDEYSASRYNKEMAEKDGFEAVDTEGQSLQAANVEAAARLTNYNLKQNAIITLSSHMPNFSVVKENPSYNPETDPTYAKYDFSGYSPDKLTGDVANQILTGGQYNEKFNAYLDMIADYAKQVEGPILFRPFHEGTGSWFWWGAAFCNAETYRSIYKYTVEYLRDEKGVHNLLYVYGPGSEAATAEEYSVRYPGDGYVDMVGFDIYDRDPVDEKEEAWFNSFRSALSVVQEFAEEHGKLMAVTETGIGSSTPDPGHSQTVLHETGNKNLNWYNMLLDAVYESDASYFLLWSNFSKTNGYYTPYVDKVNEDGSLHGHETLDGFLSFFNDSRSVFAADQAGILEQINVPEVKGAVQGITGYVTSPAAGSRITEAVKLTAKITGASEDTKVTFVLRGENEQIIEAKLNGNLAEAQLDEDTLKALGESVKGTLEVRADQETIASISLIYNVPEPEEDPYEIDGFENYYGVDSMLNNKWSVNKDTGCKIDLKLMQEAGNVLDGECALSFSYQETKNGWAGATISKEVDWSDCDALQFYTIPDGNCQKVVIQLTANGMVYETYLNQYEKYAENDGKTPLLVTIPFTDFVQRDTAGNPAGGLAEDKSNVTSFGLWVNAIPDSDAIGEDGMVSGTIIYDKITAVNSGLSEATFEPVEKGFFEDVDSSDWFYNEVSYLYENKIMQGIGGGSSFAPYDGLSRSQLAVMLWRMDGSPEASYSELFSDVPSGTWYTDAVLWGNSKGIINGYSDGRFGAADQATREQIIVMLYRYAQSKGYDVEVSADLSKFKDASDVQEFSKEAMQWAVGTGIIGGKYDGTVLDPQTTASRAESAVIFTRFMKYYA